MPFSFIHRIQFPSHMKTTLLALLFAAVLAVSPLRSLSQTNSQLTDPAIESKVDALLKQMTLEEKIGQLVQYSAGQPTGPGTGRSDYEEMIAKAQVGSFLNVIEPPLINKYQHIALDKTRLHIPILFSLDVIHGFRTEFPIPLGLSATWDPAIVEKASRVAAMEASADGIRWTFSPMVDIARDARWGRMAEGAGEDPFLGSAMAAAYVRGYQGTRLDAPDSIAACAKHYVGYGAAEAGRDYNSTEISEHTLRQYYLPPFHSAVDAGVVSLMSAFNSLDGTPSTANYFTLKDVLRKEWGFQGLVVSDWNSIGELINHGIANDGATAARKAFLAGVDMDMVSSLYHDNLANLVKSGQVTEAEIDESVRHVLRVKFALGLFDHPYVDEAAAPKALFHPESLDASQNAAEHSFVLLKNDNVAGKPLLPLASTTQKIAVIGPLGDDATYPNGAPDYVGPRVGLTAALAQRIGKDHVSRFKGTGVLDANDADIAAAVAGARKADVVILALGETEDMSGEAASRAYLGLPGRQQELLEKVIATGKPAVLLIFSGRPLTLPWAFEHVPAVIEAWFPGSRGGTAIVRTLFGDVNPSGKLTVSWPRSVGQEPLYYNHLSTGRPSGSTNLLHPPTNAEQRYVTRYIDEQNSPQFPFGYGASYTTYSYGPTKISAHKFSAADLNKNLNGPPVLMAETDVTNTGSRAGNEVVQLYIRVLGTSVTEPVRMLKGFQTVAIAPGETKHVRFELKPEAFAIWGADNHFAVEASKLTVWIAPDSHRGTPAEAEITQ